MMLKKKEVFSAVVAAGLPHTRDAEQAVIGTILATPSCVLSTTEKINPEYFFDPVHKLIMSAVCDLILESKPPDLTLVYNRLREKGDNLKIGDLEGVRRLMEFNSRPEFLNHWLAEVKKYWELRTIIEVCGDIAAKGRQVAGANVEHFLSYAESKFMEIAESRVVSGLSPASQLIAKTLQEFEALFKQEGQLTGVPSGFRDLDRITSGFQPSDLIILAARPAMGKTSLALNLAFHAVFHQKKTVAFFSLEMSSTQLMQRMLASAAKIDSNKFRNGKMSTEDFDRLYPEVSKFQTDSLLFDDSPGISIVDLASRCRKAKRERGSLDLVIVDYLQLMSAGQMSSRSFQNREREISTISMGLKNLAKELSCPVIALSQLNRGLEMRPDKRPRPSDLRECVTGETLVLLADGQRIPIRDLVGQKPKVISVTSEGKLRVKKADLIWSVGKRQTFTVRLASGRVIRATENHRLLAWNAWKEIGQLKIGDRVAIARVMPEPKKCDVWPEERIAILGHMIGDGSYLNNQPLRYTTGSEACSDTVRNAAINQFNSTVKRYEGRGNWHQLVISGNGNRWHPRGLNLWLRELGIFNQRSSEKRIPKEVFKLSNSQLAILIRHLWATDGTICTRKTHNQEGHTSSFATCSRGLAEDVAALLLRFSIIARIQTITSGYKKPLYNVSISGVDFLKTFLFKIGAFGPKAIQAEKLCTAIENKKSNTNVDTLPIEFFDDVRSLMQKNKISPRKMTKIRETSYGGSSHFRFAPSRKLAQEYAGILKDNDLKTVSENDLFWDKIISIEASGQEEVYDITVPDTESWLADGIVSHNSGSLEQDSDLILFVYRDEVYNKDSNDKGIAEIIIGKNRHGPTDTVQLAFQSNHTSFYNLSHMS